MTSGTRLDSLLSSPPVTQCWSTASRKHFRIPYLSNFPKRAEFERKRRKERKSIHDVTPWDNDVEPSRPGKKQANLNFPFLSIIPHHPLLHTAYIILNSTYFSCIRTHTVLEITAIQVQKSSENGRRPQMPRLPSDVHQTAARRAPYAFA